jgi:hypothetical protein
MENLETLVTIITEKNKIINELETKLQMEKDSAMFWFNKVTELEEELSLLKSNA